VRGHNYKRAHGKEGGPPNGIILDRRGPSLSKGTLSFNRWEARQSDPGSEGSQKAVWDEKWGGVPRGHVGGETSSHANQGGRG